MYRVISVSASSQLPNYFSWLTNIKTPAREYDVTSNHGHVDYDFIDVFGIKIVEGRNFSREFSSDAEGAFLLNETAVKALGWDDPVGRELLHWSGASRKIVGIMKDFHFHSLHHPIGPLFLFLHYSEIQYISVKINTAHLPETLDFLENTMKEFSPNYPFEYNFFDEIFERSYKSEQILGNIFSVFMGIAIIITCLGLFGLAAFTAEQKTKELGIRKVLGASVPGIIFLLLMQFIK